MIFASEQIAHLQMLSALAMIVKVDLNGYRPVSFDELMENNRKFKAAHEEQQDEYHK